MACVFLFLASGLLFYYHEAPPKKHKYMCVYIYICTHTYVFPQGLLNSLAYRLQTNGSYLGLRITKGGDSINRDCKCESPVSSAIVDKSGSQRPDDSCTKDFDSLWLLKMRADQLRNGDNSADTTLIYVNWAKQKFYGLHYLDWPGSYCQGCIRVFCF